MLNLISFLGLNLTQLLRLDLIQPLRSILNRSFVSRAEINEFYTRVVIVAHVLVIACVVIIARVLVMACTVIVAWVLVIAYVVSIAHVLVIARVVVIPGQAAFRSYIPDYTTQNPNSEHSEKTCAQEVIETCLLSLAAVTAMVGCNPLAVLCCIVHVILEIRLFCRIHKAHHAVSAFVALGGVEHEGLPVLDTDLETMFLRNASARVAIEKKRERSRNVPKCRCPRGRSQRRNLRGKVEEYRACRIL